MFYKSPSPQRSRWAGYYWTKTLQGAPTLRGSLSKGITKRYLIILEWRLQWKTLWYIVEYSVIFIVFKLFLLTIKPTRVLLLVCYSPEQPQGMFYSEISDTDTDYLQLLSSGSARDIYANMRLPLVFQHYCGCLSSLLIALLNYCCHTQDNVIMGTTVKPLSKTKLEAL